MPRIIDTYPAYIYDPSISPPAAYHKNRWVVDRISDGVYIGRVFGYDPQSKLPMELVRFEGVRINGGSRRGTLVRADSSLITYQKQGGCGCQDPLKKAKIPELETA